MAGRNHAIGGLGEIGHRRRDERGKCAKIWDRGVISSRDSAGTGVE
jgi:hypothetical protein